MCLGGQSPSSLAWPGGVDNPAHDAYRGFRFRSSLRKVCRMDADRFDTLTRSLASGRSRRGLLTGVAGLVGSLGLALGPYDVEARKKKRKRKKKKRKRKTGAGATAPPPPPPLLSPPPPPPITSPPPPGPCDGLEEWSSCGDGLFCQGGACLSGAGSCEDGADHCAQNCTGGNCPCGSNCQCHQTLTGATRCGRSGGCDDCATDNDCIELHGLGAFCAARNEVVCASTGCPGAPVNFCGRPCAG
jgi:hypothetical protein